MTQRLLLAGLAVAMVVIEFDSPAGGEAGKPVADFALFDPAGKKWTLHEQETKVVVVAFLATECPMSNGYLPVLAELNKQYAKKCVAFVGVIPDAEITAKEVADHAKQYMVPFPLFADRKQASVSALGAKITPEVVVLDDKFVVRYRGRIDDGYTARLKPRPAVTRHDLREAINELLAGKPVSVAETKPHGCPIAIAEKPPAASDAPVTFYRDVLPIFAAHCQTCHRPGQVGPFALTTYKESAKWAELCLEEIKAKRMPPWKAAPSDILAAERTLPAAKAKVIRQWVDAGMPEGDPKDAPPPATFTDDWTFGEPDLILEAPSETTVAATGRDHFRVVVFPTEFPEDKYIAAMEVKPGNPRVVHHTIQLIDSFGVARKLQAAAQAQAKPDDPDRGPGFAVQMGVGFLPDPAGFIGGWAPGMLPKMLPEGTGIRLPKGADVCVQFHYHRTGKQERDRTRIGVYFAKKPVKERFTTIPVAGLFWGIPAGAKHYRVESAWKLREDVTLYRMVPHMHLLGKDIELVATVPGGKPRTLIRIPEWDFYWQEQYELKEPLKLPAGTVLRVRATYDNSPDNPNNPSSPPKVVRIGEQTTDEMCFVVLGVSSTGAFPQIMLPVVGK